MKILLINQHFHPEVASSGQIMTELCADLVKEGYQVTALTGKPTYRREVEQEHINVKTKKISTPEWKKVVGSLLGPLTRIMPIKTIDFDRAFGIYIIRIYVYSPRLKDNKWRYIQRAFQYITFFISSFIAALLLPKHDVVIYLSTPPLLNGITANVLKILKGSVGVYNIQDLYPDVAVKLGVVKNDLIMKVCNAIEKTNYKFASAIVPIGDKMAEELKHKGVPSKKIEVINNWTDADLIKPLGKNTPFARQHGLVEKFVVMYSGNMGLSQGLEVILECAELTKNSDIFYVLVGGGESRDALMAMAEAKSLNNVRFLPYQPKERLSESLSAADLHLLPLKKGLSSYGVPSKVYGIMASGKPIVASVDEDSEVARMIERAQCGTVVKPEDPEALAEAVIRLYNEKEQLDRLGNNGRNYLESTSTRAIGARRYIDLIKKVTS